MSVWANGKPLEHGFRSPWPRVSFQPLLPRPVSHRPEQLGTSATWQPRRRTAGPLTFCPELLRRRVWGPWEGLGNHTCTILTCWRASEQINGFRFYSYAGWFWHMPEDFLELPWIKQTAFPWGGQFNNIFLDELSLLCSLLQGSLFWFSKITFPNKPLTYYPWSQSLLGKIPD